MENLGLRGGAITYLVDVQILNPFIFLCKTLKFNINVREGFGNHPHPSLLLLGDTSSPHKVVVFFTFPLSAKGARKKIVHIADMMPPKYLCRVESNAFLKSQSTAILNLKKYVFYVFHPIMHLKF